MAAFMDCPPTYMGYVNGVYVDYNLDRVYYVFPSDPIPVSEESIDPKKEQRIKFKKFNHKDRKSHWIK